MLKELKKQVSEPLSIIFRKSLDKGEIPKDWKKDRVVPIYKKGSE
jgi:hypothetical protein